MRTITLTKTPHLNSQTEYRRVISRVPSAGNFFEVAASQESIRNGYSWSVLLQEILHGLPEVSNSYPSLTIFSARAGHLQPSCRRETHNHSSLAGVSSSHKTNHEHFHIQCLLSLQRYGSHHREIDRCEVAIRNYKDTKSRQSGNPRENKP